jgi:proline iminopeptidase
VILFDQRGAGKSTPVGECRNNTTQLLIGDIERLRAMFGIEQWLVFGGSWGSTLALAYGQAHPERCLGFVLRGIFLCTQPEIDFFLEGARWFHPDVYDEFVAPIPAEERGNLLQAYVKRIMSDDPAVYWPAARAWSRFEGRRVFLLPQPEEAPSDALDLGVGRLESHYMANLGFFEEGQLLRNVDRIAHLPAVIVQGRYDVICPPVSAWSLHKAWPGSVMKMIPDAGHGAMERGISAALVAATEQFKRLRRFE